MPVERMIIEWQLGEDAREKQRLAVLMKWAQESSGNAAAFRRYRYNVERLPKGWSGVIAVAAAALMAGCHTRERSTGGTANDTMSTTGTSSSSTKQDNSQGAGSKSLTDTNAQPNSSQQ